MASAFAATHFGLDRFLPGLILKLDNLDQADSHEFTLLMRAANNNHVSTAKWLLNNGAHIDTRDRSFSGTALHYATLQRHEPMVRALLLDGASLLVDMENVTPLIYAVDLAWKDGIRIFLEAGVSIDATIPAILNPPLPGGILSQGEKAKSPRRGLTVLHYASLVGDPDMVSFLLEHQADPSMTTEYGQTPLRVAVSRDVYLSKGRPPYNWLWRGHESA